MASKKTTKSAKKASKKSDTSGAKGPGGRPTDYKDIYPELVRKLLLLKRGATDEDIADFLGKAVSTISKWKLDHPEFSEAIRAGKTHADVEVANALYNRAIGATWVEEVAFKVKNVEYDPSTGRKVREYETVEVVQLQKAAPPDTPACSLFLRNRSREDWTDKPDPIPPADVNVGEDYAVPLKPDEDAPTNAIL